MWPRANSAPNSFNVAYALLTLNQLMNKGLLLCMWLFLLPTPSPKTFWNPTHTRTTRTLIFSYQPTFVYARLRTARKTDNSMQMAEGGFGTKINNAYAFRKTRLRENLTPPLRSAIMLPTRNNNTVFNHTHFREHHTYRARV